MSPVRPSALARLALSVALVGAILPSVAAPTAQAVSPDVVISQVYGGGGNTGAPLTNDFIELFNRGAAAVSVAGWSVQYASATGATWQVTPLNGSIPPGGYYLVQESAGATPVAPLPTPDAQGTIAMSGTSGKVALVTSTTRLTCGGGTPCTSPTIRDLVGYGRGATSFEGSEPTFPDLSNSTAALRVAAGCQDTDDSRVDFVSGSPGPRNAAQAAETCEAPWLQSSTPARDALDVLPESTLSLTFSEPVAVAGTWFALNCSTSGAHAAAVSGGPTTFTLDPDVDFARNESCMLTIAGTQVTDLDANDPPDALKSDVSIMFGTLGVPARIREIQGAAHRSPLEGARVAAVPGIVTGVRDNGFYFQDPQADASTATSEGLFVFTTTATPPQVAVGDDVTVHGTVAEFRADDFYLTVTELTAPAVTTVSSDQALPAAVVIGRGGRVPPRAVFNEASPDVEVSGDFEPAQDGIDFYEALEGMRVQVNNAVVVGPSTSFNEIPVLADNGDNSSVRTPRGGIIARANDFNPERIVLDDEILKRGGGTVFPTFNVGDRVAGSIFGVVDYGFGQFLVEVSSPSPLTKIDGGLLPETTTVTLGPNELSVATFNVENLDPRDGPAKFNALAAVIVNNLAAPDLIALEEVQDNDGPTNNGVVDATDTLNRLVSAIQAAGGPLYEFRQINPVNGRDGGEPGGNIRVAFLYREDRGLEFVDRPGGGSTTAVGVTSGLEGVQLTSSPGRIEPTSSAFNNSRKPLAGEFMYNGQRLFAIANHFNSKGGDDPLFGQRQPPAQVSAEQRHRQAEIVHAFVASILALDPNANVVVLGDLNDFDFSETLDILTRDNALVQLMRRLPARERYTYVFQGNSQSLDHILVSRHLANVALPEYDIVHVNSEFAESNRTSDHDPQVVGLTLPPGGLKLNGNGAYADTPHTADLNLTGDWTIEAWFRDETPGGFNHDYGTILNKGDQNTQAEAPYFLELGYNRLIAGLRTGWAYHTVEHNLHDAGLSSGVWHAAAATFQAAGRTLTLYVNGQPVAQRTVPAVSMGNTLPVTIGRHSLTSGEYFRGRLDDIRIWHVTRSAGEIASAYRAQLSSVPPGLVANWKFDEKRGAMAADSADGHVATLRRGAAFTPDGHP